MLQKLNQQMNHYVDLQLQQCENMKTTLSILSQMESKQDLMFSHAVPKEQEVVCVRKLKRIPRKDSKA